MKPIILIKFGGSVMVPELPDADYLKNFYNFIKEQLVDYRFIFITGGGGINKKYNQIAQQVTQIAPQNLDWIGIHATRLNAQILVSIFDKDCHPKVITDPTSEFNWQEDILVAAGWKPGFSTDYGSMVLAKRFNAAKIIISTNTDYIYNKDPKQEADAQPFKELSWAKLKELVGDKWVPRMHIPLDPSAVRFGLANKLKAVSIDGRNLENLKKAIKGEELKGTIIN